MAESAVRIALKAVDNYSGVLTGLNQGLELIGKAFGFVDSAATTAFNAITKGIELARIGGAFDEQRNQFENLAKSYQLNGQVILDTVKRTSANTVSEFDSIAVATRALAAGFRGGELDDALTYVKRWSEATGESFTQVSERVFSSLSSGRYSVLRQMGLVIENGATLNDVTAAMAEGLKKFGDTGFNSADKLDALNASQDDFIRKIGQGINQSTEFQSVLGGISDGFVSIVNSFNPAVVTAFVDYLVGGVINIYQAARTAFPAVAGIIDDFYGAAQGGAESLTKQIVKTFFDIAKGAATAVNSAIDSFQSLNSGNIISGFVDAVVSGVSLAGGLFAELVSGISNVIADTLIQIDQLALYYSRKFPKIAELIGLDDVNFTDFANDLRNSVGVAADALGEGLLKAADEGVLGLKDLNGNLDSLKINLDDIDKLQESTFATIDEAAEKYKKVKDEAAGVGTTLKNLQGTGTYTVGVDLDDDALGALETLKKSTEKDVKISGKLTFEQESQKKAIADYILEKIGGVNWPAAWQQMADAFIAMLIAAAAGEDIPLAITNYQPVA